MSKIPLFKPYISAKARENVAEVLSGSQIAEGPRVEAFEAAFSEKYGLPALALNSGSSALDLAYTLAGVGRGDYVIAPVLGHPANVLPALHRGARVVWADITDGLTIDPLHVKRLFEERQGELKPKALIYVHFGGSSATLKDIKAICDEYDIALIEDAAQCAPGTEYGLGDYTCFSLQAIKFLTAGDGGMLSCKDPVKHARAKRLRWFGFDRSVPADERDIEEAGYKYHMNDIAAAIALGNLETLEKEVLVPRREVAAAYAAADLPVLCYPWLNILVHEKAMEVQNILRIKDIGCGQQHLRMDMLKVFGGERQDLPNMNRLERQYLMLPSHHALSKEDVDKIILYVRTALA